jgi:SAM-dependent methyltransferase
VRDKAVTAQERFHGIDFDYEVGSPHLRHRGQRRRIERDLMRLVTQAFARSGRCSVLEIGAGHGTFTQLLASTGSSVLVTEASAPSVERLRSQFQYNDHVEVFYDMEGDAVLRRGQDFDVIACISVLHHIPDYLAFVEKLVPLLRDGGSFYSAQDPLWYPRLRTSVRRSHDAAYLAWRATGGHLGRGVATRWRRLRGAYDDSKPSDLIEYHVVRQGVDEVAVSELLEKHFESVGIHRYWSTQAPALQWLGERSGAASTFTLQATGRRAVD